MSSLTLFQQYLANALCPQNPSSCTNISFLRESHRACRCPHSPSLSLAGNGKWISLLCSQNKALTPRPGSFSVQKSYQRPWGFAGESLTAVIWKGDWKAATREGLVSVQNLYLPSHSGYTQCKQFNNSATLPWWKGRIGSRLLETRGRSGGGQLRYLCFQMGSQPTLRFCVGFIRALHFFKRAF